MRRFSKTEGQIKRETAADLRKAARTGVMVARHRLVAEGFLRSNYIDGKVPTTPAEIRKVLLAAAKDASEKSRDPRYTKGAKPYSYSHLFEGRAS